MRGQGYDGAHDSVHRFVKTWRDERSRVPAHAFVPMSFAPGEAYQFDLSHETITLQGLPGALSTTPNYLTAIQPAGQMGSAIPPWPSGPAGGIIVKGHPRGIDMAGTLLVYDDAFPRASVATGPIRNTPGADELRANSYPEPYRLLPIWEASPPDNYFGAIADAAEAMGRLSRLIIFGHGRVANAAVPTGITRVTTGIILGASDITASNASMLRNLRGRFAPHAQAELWVCEAAAAGESGGHSGVVLCQSIADALGVSVLAATIAQQYTTANQREAPGGGWQSTAQFLPWEGTTVLFTPRRRG